MPFTFRTRFKNEIVTEFLPPARATKKQRVIILCDGMPSTPAKRSLVQFFSKKGYWTFYPRYRGSWESGGVFLEKSPHEDVLDLISELPRGFTSLWDEKRYRVRPDEIFIIAGSFGGRRGFWQVAMSESIGLWRLPPSLTGNSSDPLSHFPL